MYFELSIFLSFYVYILPLKKKNYVETQHLSKVNPTWRKRRNVEDIQGTFFNKQNKKIAENLDEYSDVDGSKSNYPKYKSPKSSEAMKL